MAFDPTVAFELFIGGTLAGVALLVAFLVRERRERYLMAFFLVLVATNFIGGTMYRATGSIGAVQIAWLALAMDPLFLLLFVTAYPWERRTGRVRLLIGASAMVAAACAALVLVRPEAILFGFSALWGTVRPAGFYLIVAHLTVVYAASWGITLNSAIRAPTPLLRRRALWVTAALGVAVAPRLAVVPHELGWYPGLGAFLLAPLRAGNGIGPWHDPTLAALLSVAIAGVGITVLARGAWRTGDGSLRDGGRFLGVAIGALVALVLVFEFLESYLPWIDLSRTPRYGLRWLVFSVVLLHGLVSTQALELRRRHTVVVPNLGGVVLATFIGLVTMTALTNAELDGALAGAISVAVGLAALSPSIAFVRQALASLGSDGGALGGARRLDMYRASLERAWANGEPDAAARRKLHRDRRAFRVSRDEAAVLEHVVVSGRASGGPQSLAVGDEVAPGIVLEELLGQGSGGRAWKARRHGHGDHVVVKEVHRAPGQDEAARQRLLAEFDSLRDLDHPNIVGVRDLHITPERYLVLREWVDGRPLDQLLGDGPLPSEDVARIARDVLAGLAAAHDAGVVHRDVKPSNILVGRDGHAYVFDFDIAQEAAPVEQTLQTLAGQRVGSSIGGTLAYMSPEQANGEDADPRSDLYSAGLVIYEALTGERARDLRGYGAYEALRTIADGGVDLARVPAEWVPVLRDALAAMPAERYATAAAMVEAIPPVADSGATRRGRATAQGAAGNV